MAVPPSAISGSIPCIKDYDIAPYLSDIACSLSDTKWNWGVNYRSLLKKSIILNIVHFYFIFSLQNQMRDLLNWSSIPLIRPKLADQNAILFHSANLYISLHSYHHSKITITCLKNKLEINLKLNKTNKIYHLLIRLNIDSKQVETGLIFILEDYV